MTVTLQEPTCSGAKLAGTFHSVTTDGIGNGTTQFTGTYDSATQLLSRVETSPVATSGIIVASQDTITYDPSTDELINGLSICSPPTAAGCSNVSPMVWSARRVVGDAGAGPGDAINGPG
jgi:hypothetical protein